MEIEENKDRVERAGRGVSKRTRGVLVRSPTIDTIRYDTHGIVNNQHLASRRESRNVVVVVECGSNLLWNVAQGQGLMDHTACRRHTRQHQLGSTCPDTLGHDKI